MNIVRRLGLAFQSGLAAAVLLFAGCHKGGGEDTAAVPQIWNLYNGDRAFADVKALVDIGPRPSGSAAIEKARQYIIAQVRAAGWTVTEQPFDDSTPRGPIHFINLIARFGKGDTTQQAIVCSHYDTKIFDTIRFVGASDGGSSTGALIELARTLAHDPALAKKVELVFFDGEEAVVQFNETDGLYGSRYYAMKLRDSGRYRQFKFGILWDMMGPRNLIITLSTDSPPALTGGILKAADALHDRQHFTFFKDAIYDDHVPLDHIAEIPSVDLIDFDYPPWHTAADTLDKLSPDSLKIVGDVTLYYLRQQFP
ncbi:MAG TPA: M28 family peptidase [Chthoniobacteraceae bacterium]|jgi:Zn-dependent M28 family amino/carboxypeptidase|nr:M28 family peptidase [Chthoniobacteraceae bacterium]